LFLDLLSTPPPSTAKHSLTKADKKEKKKKTQNSHKLNIFCDTNFSSFPTNPTYLFSKSKGSLKIHLQMDPCLEGILYWGLIISMGEEEEEEEEENFPLKYATEILHAFIPTPFFFPSSSPEKKEAWVHFCIGFLQS
jgi:hypothetical protein